MAAHGWEDWFWAAGPTRMSAGKGIGPFTLQARRGGSGQWTELRQVGKPVVSLASRGAELAVLLNDGDWLLVAPPSDEVGQAATAATGQRIGVAGAKLLAFTNDGSTLLALAEVPGGVASIRSESTGARPASRGSAPTAPATRPSVPTTDPATTAPATNPAETPAGAESPTTIPATLPTPAGVSVVASNRLTPCILRLTPGGWTGEADVPPGIGRAGDEMSLAVVGGARFLAVRSAPGVQLFRLEKLGYWMPIGGPLDIGADRPFKLLTGAPVPLLWAAGRATAEPDGLWRYTRDQSHDGWAPAAFTLDASRNSEPALRTAAYANGAVRVLFWRDSKFLEQAFDPATGAPQGSPMPLAWSSPDQSYGFAALTTAVVIAAMGFSIFASMRQWSKMRDVSRESLAAAGVRLAPLGPRFLAGSIDAAPLLAALAIYAYRTGANPNAFDPTAEVIRWTGVGIYIAHTLFSEWIAGRSLGKAICGLRVVALDGSKPRTSQIVIRNLLRIIDAMLWLIPVALVPFSPLRQRAGDAAAGTLVVAPVEPEAPDEDEKDLGRLDPNASS